MTTKSLHRPNSTWTFTHYYHRLNLSWWRGTDVKGSLILSFSIQCWKYFHGFFWGLQTQFILLKIDQVHQRSVFWQFPSKSHSFVSTFDITFLQITWGIILPYRSQRKTVSVHIPALISPPQDERRRLPQRPQDLSLLLFEPSRAKVKRDGSSILLKCMWKRQAGLVSSSVPTSESPDPFRMLLPPLQLFHEHRTSTDTFSGCISTAVPALQPQIPFLSGSVLALICVCKTCEFPLLSSLNFWILIYP